jgi:hypothetical protein
VAHANLLLGRFEEAREIYLRLSKSDDYPCRFNVQSDFAELRKAGRDHPDMKKIEALLGIEPSEKRILTSPTNRVEQAKAVTP